MPDISGVHDLYLSDLSPSDKPWDTHRQNAEVVQALYAGTDHDRYAIRIRDCSRLLGFALEAQDAGEFKIRLQTARFCRVRHCPVCQWRRSLMWRARFFKALPEVIEAYPTARYLFLTLTVRNCPLESLRDTIGDMNRAWERMSKRKVFPALGFVRSVEVTRGKDGTAHPHFHCLLMVKASYFSTGYIKQAEWTELWKQALRADYTPVVNVKTVKGKASDRAGELPGEIVRGLLETLKYGVKEADLIADTNWLTVLTEQLHKTRAVSVGGVFKDFISEQEPEDLVHGDEPDTEVLDEDINVWFGWREMVKKYAKTDRE